jgi:HSF-type DNA-binding
MDNNRDSKRESGGQDASRLQNSEEEIQARLHTQQTTLLLPPGQQLPLTDTQESAPYSLTNEAAAPAIPMAGVAAGLGPMTPAAGGQESHDNQSLQSWLAMPQQQFGGSAQQPMAQQNQLIWQPTLQQLGTQQPFMFPRQPQSQFINVAAATADHVLRHNVDPASAAAAAAATGLQMQNNPFLLAMMSQQAAQPVLSQQDEQVLAAFNQQLALPSGATLPAASSTTFSAQQQSFPQGQSPDVALTTLQHLLGLQPASSSGAECFGGLPAVALGTNHDALAASFPFPMYPVGRLHPQLLCVSLGTTGPNATSVARAATKSASKDSESGNKPPAGDGKEKNNKKISRQQESFPQKLYRMLIELEAVGDDDIVSFSVDGDGFEVHQPTVFAEIVIPKYYRHNKLTSFHRQCGLYGFKRIAEGPNAGAFRHALFRKGQPELCNQIKRVK